ncbi:hypothetical protein [Peribacillus frigoritolerans]|uniref:hypothetical protein n=1 Tax=Peribacillus castrilensis TaxID=2897690 RepID=UPI003DA5E898
MKDKLVLKRVWNKTSQQFLLLKHKVDWNGRYETPAGKSERLKWKSTFTAKKKR